jgi:hypothetical protein
LAVKFFLDRKKQLPPPSALLWLAASAFFRHNQAVNRLFEKTLALACVGLWMTPLPLCAKPGDEEEERKKGTRSEKTGDYQDFALGPIGGFAEVDADSAEIQVKRIDPQGPGERAGLRAGDVILAAQGRKFSAHTRPVDLGGQGPTRELGEAIEAAESSLDGKLNLRVRRDGAEMDLAVMLPPLGAWSKNYPMDCRKSALFYEGICQWLVANQGGAGNWGQKYTTSLCALALLGRGDGRHLPALQKAAEYLAAGGTADISDDLVISDGLGNWRVTVGAIYLAEYALATGDLSVVPAIQRSIDYLAARVAENGRMAHDFGSMIGYDGAGINIINAQMHLAMALAEQVGCKVDAAAWKRSLDHVKQSTYGGGVAYVVGGTLDDGAGRTGAMALALHVRSQEKSLLREMQSYLEKTSGRMREAHAMASIGVIYHTCAIRCLAPRSWRKHMDDWSWYLNLMRQPDFSADYIGSKRNNGGDGYLGKKEISHAMAGMMLASGLGKLRICGGTATGWLRPAPELPPLSATRP